MAELVIKIDDQTYSNFVHNEYSRADVIAIHAALVNSTPRETVTEFADRCRECGAKYGKLLNQKLKTVLEDIKAEIKEWYWQADKQTIAKDPCVVDAMIDLFIRTINAHESQENTDLIDQAYLRANSIDAVRGRAYREGHIREAEELENARATILQLVKYIETLVESEEV